MNITAIVNGREYSLDDMAYCRWISHDGLGMAPMHRLSERGPLQDGNTDRGYRLDPRIIRLVLSIIKGSQLAYEYKRSDIITIFKPSNTPITLKFELEAQTLHIDCHYIGEMSMPSADKHGYGQIVMVELVANDPTFYDPEANSYSFSLGGSSETMEVPTVIPMDVGASTIDATEIVINDGQITTYPTMRITGPITDPIITNNTTGEVLDFTGTTISGGDYYDIDLRYGYKTVTDSSSVNKLSDLTSDSDLVTWHLSASDSMTSEEEVLHGLNSINITGSGCTQATRFDLAWLNRYLGI